MLASDELYVLDEHDGKSDPLQGRAKLLFVMTAKCQVTLWCDAKQHGLRKWQMNSLLYSSEIYVMSTYLPHPWVILIAFYVFIFMASQQSKRHPYLRSSTDVEVLSSRETSWATSR